MHGHCNHTCKISGAADSQNTQHFLFLHFESSTAFLQRLSFPYSLHYTHFLRNFNHFVQLTFSVFIYSAQFQCLPMNCKKRFLQFILHFPACIAPAPFLQEHPHLRQNPGGFCRISAAFLQPHSYSCISPCIFSVSSVIFEAFPCKNRRGPVEGSRRSVQLPSKICEIPPQTQPLHDHLVFAHAAG